MNLEQMLRARSAWNVFRQNHPKVPVFIDSVENRGFCEGMEIAIAVRYPDGEQYKTGIRVTAEDMELMDMLRSMKQF